MKVILVVSLLFLFSRCNSVFYAYDFEKIKTNHKEIAIFPYEIYENVDTLSRVKSDTSLAEYVQILLFEIYKKEYNNYAVLLQPSDTTKKRIEALNITRDSLSKISPSILAKILNVDGVLKSKCYLSHPLYENNILQLALLSKYGSWSSTAANKMSINLELLDGKNNKLIWQFSREISGGSSTTGYSLATRLSRIVMNQLPYKKISN